MVLLSKIEFKIHRKSLSSSHRIVFSFRVPSFLVVVNDLVVLAKFLVRIALKVFLSRDKFMERRLLVP